MSLTNADTRHLTVLGLSTHDEKDALAGLLAAARPSSSPVSDDEDNRRGAYRDSAISGPSRTAQRVQTRQDTKARDVVICRQQRQGSAGDCGNREEDPKKHPETQSSLRASVIHSRPKLLPEQSKVQEPQEMTFRADHVSDDVDALPPVCELVHSKLARPLKEVLHVTSLTRIQKISWLPMIDKARDVLIRSETGSGKTLAYGLPLLHQLLCGCDVHPIKRQDGTIIIILCPTRELVLQVTDVFAVLTRCALFITVGGVHGGENRHKEKARLRKGITVLITTPGRLLDHLKATSSFCVDRMQAIVLDEADRLLDMGFEQTIREVMGLLLAKVERPALLKGGRQDALQRGAHCIKRVLVSATITAGVERLSHFALRKNIARVGETEDTFSIPSSLRQHYVLVPTKHRLSTLVSFLRSQLDAGAQRIIVFVSTADSAEFHYYLLSRLKSPFSTVRWGSHQESSSPHPRAHRYSLKKRIEDANKHVHDSSEAVVTFDDDSDDDCGKPGLSETNAMLDVNIFKLHGNMSQVDRASVFHAFKHGNSGQNCTKKGLLFCTDVAARGLDMPKVDWIVHYDPPTDETCYIHRIGRTARIGNVGDSILFLMPHEAEYVAYLRKSITGEGIDSAHAGNDVPTPTITMEERKYESFLFYLTKLDPKANHMWMQSMSTLERAISRLVMKRDEALNDSSENGRTASDDLTRLALFAYRSYIRAYTGRSKNLKRLCFDSSALHLGHVAQSFGVDKKPGEVQMQIQSIIREDRKIARETSFVGADKEEGRPRRRLRVEVFHDDRYRSMVVQKQRKVTRDWYENKKSQQEPPHRALKFTEFDA